MYLSNLWVVVGVFTLLLISCSDRQKIPETIPSNNQADTGRTPGVSALNTTLTNENFSKAKHFAQAAQYDSAIAYFEKASLLYEKENDWENYARCYNQMGKSAWYNWALEQAAFYLNKALKIGINHLGENHPTVAESYYLFGLVYTDQDDFDRVIQSLDKALSIQLSALGELHLDVANTYNALGLYYEKKGQYDQALVYYEKGLEIKQQLLGEQDPAVGVSCNNMAIAYWQKGDYDRAFAFSEKAISIFRVAYGEEHPKVGFAYNDLANIYQQKGDYDQALVFYQKAVSIHTETLGGKSAHTGVGYLNIGLVHFDKGNYDLAIDFSQKALSIFLKTMGEQGDEVAYCYINLGNSYKEKGNYKRALVFYDKALSIYTARYGGQHPTAATIFDSKAIIYQQQGNYNHAGIFFDKALSSRLAVLGEFHPDVATSYNHRGDLYYEKGDYDQAIAFYQQAMRANVPAFAESGIYPNPPLENILSEKELLKSLEQKGRVLAARYGKKSAQLQDLKAAVSTYDRAVRLIDRMRSGYKTEGSKFTLAEKVSGIYDRGIQTAIQLFRQSNNPEYKKTAFLFAEKSKTGILLEALYEAEARQFAGIPGSLLEREKQLRIDLAYYERSLTGEQLKRQAADSAYLALWENKRFDVKQKYDALLRQFEKEYPEYFKLKYQSKTVSVAEIQEAIPDKNSTLVEYFVGEDSIYIFILSPERFDIALAAKDSLFQQAITQLRSGIVTGSIKQYTNAARWLYQLLLTPVEDKLVTEKLIIIPHGLLNYLPFEVLLTSAVEDTTAAKEYQALPFLLKKFAISYAYSATLLMETIQRQRSRPEHDYLAYAPIFSNEMPPDNRHSKFNNTHQDFDSTRSLKFSPLLATEAEVLNIRNLFLEKAGLWKRLFGANAVVSLNKEANEANLKSHPLEKYRYLHFATHGLINETNPKLSGLILAQDTTRTEDGILHLGEIYNLSLNADLVVLSACETGLGKIARGEGLIGLTRGFLYAGAQNLLVSLWQVNDASTANVMVDFYRNILDGKNKAGALREAKLKMIESNPQYARPFYWAPFVLIGR
jgi:CHAT domain-containing protein/Tfp pilus assembly protein PilF